MTRKRRAFWYLRLRLMRQELLSLDVGKMFKWGVFFLLGIFFVLFIFFFFWRLISMVVGMVELRELRFTFLINLLNMVFLIFLGMVLFSNIVTALSTFFMSRDLELLLSSPLSFLGLFRQRFIKTFGISSWMIVVFGLPVFMAYGVGLKSPFIYYPGILFCVTPFLVITTSLGIIVTVMLMRFFPARRTHQVIASLGVFLGTGLVVMIRMLKPENFVRPISAERLELYDRMLRIPTASWLPSTWATESLMALINGRSERLWEYVGLLWVVGLALTYFCYLITRAYYLKAFSRAQESDLFSLKTSRKRAKQRCWERLLSRLPAQEAAFLIRDTKIFFREVTQWSQLFLLAAILFIYLYNIRNLPLFSWYLSNFYAFLNVGMAGFVLAALAARFVYPAVSGEGRAAWVLFSAPLRFGRYLLITFVFYVLPLLSLGIIVIVISNHFLNVDGYMRWVSLYLIFLISPALVGLGLGLGGLYPKFNSENIAQVAVSAGGIIYMLSSLVYLLLVIILEATPVYQHFQQMLQGKESLPYAMVPYHAGVLVLSLAVAILPLVFAGKSLPKTQWR